MWSSCCWNSSSNAHRDRRIARRQPRLLAGSSHSDLNEAPLRQAITRRALQWGCPIAADELVVTNSCAEAMMLCLRAVTKPGDTVAVESPTYYVMLQLLESMGLRALAKPALRMAAAAGAMAIAVLLVRSGVHAAMEPGRLAALAVVGLGVAAAMAVYGVAVWRLFPESTHRVLMIRRRRGG